MDKRRSAAEVNSSFTIFFAISAIGIALIFSTSFAEYQNKSWLIMTCYALLIYFMWDFIKQLYSPGQSVIIYCLTFIILPFIFTNTIGNLVPQAWQISKAAFVIWLGATIMAGFIEIIYEFATRSILPSNVIRRLTLVDNKVDKSLLEINDNHLSFFNFRGLIFAVILIIIFYVFSYLLFTL